VIHTPEEASATAIADALRAFRMSRQPDQQQRRAARRALVAIAAAESRAALMERTMSERPFVERLVAFWSNHLCVSVAAKVLVAPLAGSYEREAIRPHVLGRFEDLVLASARHPAMLVYLDNFQSIGPNSAAARRARRERGPRGLNENYARELLELHTLGVNGGYSQQDVQELARTLTGWTIGGLRDAAAIGQRRPAERSRQRTQPVPGRDGDVNIVRFAYQERLHEPGARTVLRVRYADVGVSQGERVIRDLCRHPSTSRFIATKLVAHFVADDPPRAAVERIATVFRETDGDLRIVSGALVDLREAWSAETRKFRTPQDWLVAVLRAFGVREIRDTATSVLRQLRHPLWAPQAPKGFGDTLQEWADPDSLLKRGELARTIARRTGIGQVDPRTLLDVVDLNNGDPLKTMVSDASIPIADRVALALAGPALQWR
jgi:uncharacterized protein (DUF1800 family)